jgi:hypothetical protein
MTIQIIGHNAFACRFTTAWQFELSGAIANILALDGDLEVLVTPETSIIVEAGEYVNAYLGSSVLSVSGTVRMKVKDGCIVCEALDEPKFKLSCKCIVFTDHSHDKRDEDGTIQEEA